MALVSAQGYNLSSWVAGKQSILVSIGIDLGTLVKNHEWHHYALTWDGSSDTAKLYVDGVELATKTDASFGVLGYPGHDRIHFMGVSVWPLNGMIDEVRISDKALSFNRHG